MSVATRQHRQREELRSRILDAARELFAAEGYEAVTMQRIAGSVEYTPGALYRHFPDKATLFRALVATDFAAFTVNFRHLPQIADPIERIRESGKAYVEFGLTHPHHYRLLFLQPRACPPDDDQNTHPDPGASAYHLLRNAVAEAITQERLRPELQDADAVAQALWASVHGIVALHLTMSEAPWLRWQPPRATNLLLADTLLRGFERVPQPDSQEKS